MRDTPTDDHERTLFDRDDIAMAARILGDQRLCWIIATAVGTRDASQDEQRQCVEALAEAVEAQQPGVGRGIRLAALLVRLGLQPMDESE